MGEKEEEGETRGVSSIEVPRGRLRENIKCVLYPNHNTCDPNVFAPNYALSSLLCRIVFKFCYLPVEVFLLIAVVLTEHPRCALRVKT